MVANNVLQITSTNFDDIVEGLRQYLAANPDFADYDFEGSALSTLTDLLGYDTYFRSINLFQVANESTLATAQLRNSAVSRAKMINYMPKGSKGAQATIRLTFTPDSDNPTRTITIPKNTQFTSNIDGIDYNFVNLMPAYATTENNFTVDVEIIEGIPLQHRFLVDTSTTQRYILPNRGIDTQNIDISVQESSTSTDRTPYTRAENITEINKNSTVYFLQENYDNQYEIYFGDGILGKRLENQNIIHVSYYVNHGIAGNGAAVFTPPASIDGNDTFEIETISPARNGVDVETLESIKFNAPKTYAAQNRAVVAEDYRQIIKERHPELTSVRVWGGEENNPPVFGRVVVSTYPSLSILQRNNLITYLRGKNTLTVNPLFVEPVFLFLVPELQVRYNSQNTQLSSDAIITKITNTIQKYERDELNTSNQDFYLSQFSTQILQNVPSIISLDINLQIQKRFNPIINTSSTYTINFNNELDYISNSNLSVISSNKFSNNTYNNLEIDDDNNQNIRTFYINPNGTKVYVNNTAGSIDYKTGQLSLIQLEIKNLQETTFDILAKPKQNDIFATRNDILLIGKTTIILFDTHQNQIITRHVSTNTLGNEVEIVETGID